MKKEDNKVEEVKQFIIVENVSYDESYGKIIIDLARITNLFFVRILSKKNSFGWVATFGSVGKVLESDELRYHYLALGNWGELENLLKEEGGEIISWKLTLDKSDTDSYKKEFNQFYNKVQKLQEKLLKEKGIEEVLEC